MADTVSQVNPANFAAGTPASFPASVWRRVAILADDGGGTSSGTWHGFQLIASPNTIVRRVLVAPSAPYATALATIQTAFTTGSTQLTNARSQLQSLRVAIQTAATGGTALTGQQTAQAIRALIVLFNST
jgi:hypothetical protein